MHGSRYNDIAASSTSKTYTVYGSRNFSNYKILIFALSNWIIRTSVVVPYNLFKDIGNASLSYVDTSNVERWVEIKYISDTSFSVNGSENINPQTYVTIYGLLIK